MHINKIFRSRRKLSIVMVTLLAAALPALGGIIEIGGTGNSTQIVPFCPG